MNFLKYTALCTLLAGASIQAMQDSRSSAPAFNPDAVAAPAHVSQLNTKNFIIAMMACGVVASMLNSENIQAFFEKVGLGSLGKKIKASLAIEVPLFTFGAMGSPVSMYMAKWGMVVAALLISIYNSYGMWLISSFPLIGKVLVSDDELKKHQKELVNCAAFKDMLEALRRCDEMKDCEDLKKLQRNEKLKKFSNSTALTDADEFKQCIDSEEKEQLFFKVAFVAVTMFPAIQRFLLSKYHGAMAWCEMLPPQE